MKRNGVIQYTIDLPTPHPFLLDFIKIREIHNFPFSKFTQTYWLVEKTELIYTLNLQKELMYLIKN